MAKIRFNNYVVEHMNYTENPSYKDEKTEQYEDLYPNLHADVFLKDDYVLVSLSVEMGNFENIKCPFFLELEISGLFSYEYDKDNEKDVDEMKTMLSQNTIAILFPYVRNLVSSLTLQSNRFPAYIFPVINVVKMMQDEDKIEIHDLR